MVSYARSLCRGGTNDAIYTTASFFAAIGAGYFSFKKDDNGKWRLCDKKWPLCFLTGTSLLRMYFFYRVYQEKKKEKNGRGSLLSKQLPIKRFISIFLEKKSDEVYLMSEPVERGLFHHFCHDLLRYTYGKENFCSDNLVAFLEKYRTTPTSIKARDTFCECKNDDYFLYAFKLKIIAMGSKMAIRGFSLDTINPLILSHDLLEVLKSEQYHIVKEEK
jgi:hypothetical protein